MEMNKIKQKNLMIKVLLNTKPSYKLRRKESIMAMTDIKKHIETTKAVKYYEHVPHIIILLKRSTNGDSSY